MKDSHYKTWTCLKIIFNLKQNLYNTYKEIIYYRLNIVINNVVSLTTLFLFDADTSNFEFYVLDLESLFAPLPYSLIFFTLLKIRT
jgi:hypothetical protein